MNETKQTRPDTPAGAADCCSTDCCSEAERQLCCPDGDCHCQTGETCVCSDCTSTPD